jgi:hypothetical protein
MTDNRCLQKASELLPACSNQAMNDKCQNYWNMKASKLINYNARYDLSFKMKLWAYSSMQTGGFMNFVIILISTQIAHLKPTSKLVHLKCTLKVSVLLRTILFHLSILKNSSPPPLISTLTQFCLKAFPQKALRKLRHFHRKILIYKCS